jgi:hypothetical protein
LALSAQFAAAYWEFFANLSLMHEKEPSIMWNPGK